MDQVEETYHQLETVLQYLPETDRELIANAFRVARAAHGTQTRKSGGPYILHPLAIALTLAKMRMDAASIATAMLHDVLEDTELTYEDLRREFGIEIAQLVLGLTKFDERFEELRAQRLQNPEQLTEEQREAASLGNLFLAMTADLRVIIIKLADRLHNMQTLEGLSPEKGRRMAQETDDLFVPTATRLGIWVLKQQLSDLCLKELQPDVYKEISEMLAARARLLNGDVEAAIAQLHQHLEAHGLKAVVAALDNPVSTHYRKLLKHGGDSTCIYGDLRLRVVVETQLDCYVALGLIHQLWMPLPGKIEDYIAAPEQELYRSLHTSVMGLHGHHVEIRIRTQQMQQLSDYGIAVYLQHGQTEALPSLHWLQGIAALPEKDPQTFLSQVKSKVDPKRIRVFTPNGDVVNLPEGATPVDFAYAIHTEIGDKCQRALINRQEVPLNTPLSNGVQVEIITALRPAPERKWLDTDLGYVRSPDTMRNIRRWFARIPEAELILQGREIIEKEIARWGDCNGWTPAHIEKLARRRGLTVDDFCLRVGRGELTPGPLGAFILDAVLEEAGSKDTLTTLEIDVMNRPRLLRDVLDVIADEGLDVDTLAGHRIEGMGLGVIHIAIETPMTRTIARIAHRLEEVQSVLRVRRITALPHT